jgi:hypothetical protein
VICIYFDPLKKQQTRKRFVTDADAKQLVFSSIRTLDTYFFPRRDTSRAAAVGKRVIISVTKWRSDVYHLLHMCHVMMSGVYHLLSMCHVMKSDVYHLLRMCHVMKSGVYHLLPMCHVMKSGVYHLLPMYHVMKSGVYHLLPTRHLYVEVRMKVSASVFVTLGLLNKTNTNPTVRRQHT